MNTVSVEKLEKEQESIQKIRYHGRFVRDSGFAYVRRKKNQRSDVYFVYLLTEYFLSRSYKYDLESPDNSQAVATFPFACCINSVRY